MLSVLRLVYFWRGASYLFQGLFLNLDRDAVRRAHIERELATVGLSDAYQRVPAVDGRALDASWEPTKAGAKGCFLSHVAALEVAAAFDGITHVIEDDAKLNEKVAPFLESPAANQALAKFDIVFLSLWIDYDRLPSLLAKRRAVAAGEFDAFDIRDARISSTDSYIVNGKGATTLHRILKSVGPVKPIDNMLQYLVQLREIKAGFVLPFVTTIEPNVGVNSSIIQIPFDRYRLLTIGRQLVAADASPVEWPDRAAVGPELLPSLDYMRSLAG
jgi:GR25 family glycosyltransferase involved in LPS biosynthesis